MPEPPPALMTRESGWEKGREGRERKKREREREREKRVQKKKILPVRTCSYFFCSLLATSTALILSLSRPHAHAHAQKRKTNQWAPPRAPLRRPCRAERARHSTSGGERRRQTPRRRAAAASRPFSRPIRAWPRRLLLFRPRRLSLRRPPCKPLAGGAGGEPSGSVAGEMRT